MVSSGRVQLWKKGLTEPLVSLYYEDRHALTSISTDSSGVDQILVAEVCHGRILATRSQGYRTLLTFFDTQFNEVDPVAMQIFVFDTINLIFTNLDRQNVLEIHLWISDLKCVPQIRLVGEYGIFKFVAHRPCKVLDWIQIEMHFGLNVGD